MPTHLEIIDEIAILNLGDDENRFSPDWLTTVNGYLDRIESLSEAPIRYVSVGTRRDQIIGN